jgi:hypothetical protein
MFGSAGSLCSRGTPSASSVYGGSSFPASNAFDSNLGTFWHSNGNPNSSPEWVKYTFASPVEVHFFAVYPRDSFLNQAPSTFKLQYSDDDSAWTDATSNITASWSQESVKVVPVSTATGHYNAVRLRAPATQNGAATQASEIQFHSSVGGSNITSGGVAIASETYNSVYTYMPANAFDGNTATIWAVNSSSNAWIGYVFPTAPTILEFSWQAPPSGGGNDYARGPTTIVLETSSDGVTWTTVDTFVCATWSSYLQVQTFSVAGGTGGLLIHRGMSGGFQSLNGGLNG